MSLIKTLCGCCVALALASGGSGCAVVSVASTAVSVGVTAVGIGVSAGSMAIGAATTVAKGAVSVTGAVVEKATN
jgi:hypothetical protein